MRILWHIHAYPEKHNCGAEWMAHCMNKFLISKGHQVRVLLKGKGVQSYWLDGVEVIPMGSNQLKAFGWGDVFFTHLECTFLIGFMGRWTRKPVIWIAHNSFRDAYQKTMDNDPNIKIVYNGLGTKENTDYKNDYTILHPPVDFREYDVTDNPGENEYITLINLGENKGGEIFYEVARRMPHKKFLGVKGGYEEQILETLPNVTIVEHTSKIQEVYKLTRILLMPSRYESWGRTATEAMSSGIPVIANKTFGLEENLGKAGIWADRNSIDEWVKAISLLDDKKKYEKQSIRCRQRSRELDPIIELENFNEWLLQIAS